MSFADVSFSQSVQTGSKTHFFSCPKDTGNRFVQLATHFYLVSRFGTHGAITPLANMD
jgi:hypothetical protein